MKVLDFLRIKKSSYFKYKNKNWINTNP